MAVVKRIGPGSAFKVGAVLYAFIGLIVGLFMSLFSLVGGAMMSAAGRSGVFGMGIGVASIIVFPILYAIVGGVGSALSALIYNLVAGWVGGLEVDIS